VRWPEYPVPLDPLTPAGAMTTKCPCCGLALTQAAARCPLCNERLNTFHLRARHYLTALLALEICVALVVLT
jgi:predicted amidophosphoribosyltransferase